MGRCAGRERGGSTVKFDIGVWIGLILAAVFIRALFGALGVFVFEGFAGLLFAPDYLAPFTKVFDLLCGCCLSVLGGSIPEPVSKYLFVGPRALCVVQCAFVDEPSFALEFAAAI